MKKTMLIMMFAVLIAMLGASSVTAYTDSEIAYCKKVVASLGGEAVTGGSSYNGVSTNSVDAVDPVRVDEDGRTLVRARTRAGDEEVRVRVVGDEEDNRRRFAAYAAKNDISCDDCEIVAADASVSNSERTSINKEERRRFLFWEVTASKTDIVDNTGAVVDTRANFWARLLGTS